MVTSGRHAMAFRRKALTAGRSVKAALAATYERIHRSNLIGMGVLPLQFKDGENADTHGLDGDEKRRG